MLFLPYIGDFTIYKMFVVLIISADLSEILNILGAKNQVDFLDKKIISNLLILTLNKTP